MLHVDPLQKLPAVRAELLKAIQQTNPSGHLNGQAIPEDPSEILLARPMDSNNLDLGWEAIERDVDDGLEEALKEDAKGKGKGKAAVGSSASAKKGSSAKDVADCPQGVGLRDGGIVAFKFRSEGADAVATRDKDEGIDVDDEEGGLDGETLVGEERRETWDVVVPTLEDTYGDEGPPRAGEELEA